MTPVKVTECRFEKRFTHNSASKIFNCEVQGMSPDLVMLLAPTRDTSRDDESVRIQELSLASEGEKGTLCSPGHKQHSVYGTVHSDQTTVHAELPIDKKRKHRSVTETMLLGLNATCEEFVLDERRGNKRALRTIMPGGQVEGEVVMEGMLLVVEQKRLGQETSVSITLGAMYCLLTRKLGGLLLEILSKDNNQTIELNIDAMDLVLQPCLNDCKFQLRYHPSVSGKDVKVMSYTFMAPTKGEYVKWVNRIHRFQASSSNNRNNLVDTSNNSTLFDSKRIHRLAQGQQTQLKEQDMHQHIHSSLGEFMLAMPPKTKHMILVRHGHYINAYKPHVSDSEQVLSQLGRRQAEFTGKCLRMAHNRIPKRHNMIVLYHSDLTRAVEAGAIIASHLSDVMVYSSSMLREGWPGKPYFSLTPTSSSTIDDERNKLDTARMQEAFDTFFLSPVEAQDEDDDESYCILVCHANLIRFFLCRALGIEATNTWGHFEINHCSITRIDISAHRPIKVISVNETGHLPQSLLTSSEDHL
ncbi:Predicted phosphoglycerate mutase [Plasmopara halstedii]|uniref:Serine/threonine-protein phosphatase PGAM5, mitochondrial n=1 Tax=Plasmopara halstedii TaxID=4781 RepID=A0A0P1ARP6_PLAHL|nr:Predicted phosphoglycerate mutase [Plasmopara halstedii]CEG44124.1 Predicted phosphoglycerate mutase [Plasmopara halstedii]|eukprot:XP_024580493.1 Predicted phosphoglycerate mutase [Plasmopara halstedii]